MKQLLAALFLVLTLCAAGKDEKTDEAQETTIDMKQLDQTVRVLTEKELDKLVSPRKIVEELKKENEDDKDNPLKNLTFPPKKTTKSSSDIKKFAKTFTEEQVNQIYPKSKYDAVVTKAEIKYKMYKVGQIIQFKALRRGKLKDVRGEYLGRSGNIIKVGNAKILLNDITLEDKVHFDSQIHTERKKAYINLYHGQMDDEKKKLYKKYYSTVLKTTYEKHGYIYYKKKWRSGKSIIEYEVRKKKSKLKPKVFSEIEVAVKTKAGLVKIEGKWDKPDKKKGPNKFNKFFGEDGDDDDDDDDDDDEKKDKKDKKKKSPFDDDF